MNLYITVQKLSHRGATWSTRICGTQYVFRWNPELRCYALQILNLKDANRLLDNMTNTRMFVPGLAVISDKGEILESLAPAPAPVLPEIPSAEVAPVEAPVAPAAPAEEKEPGENEEPVQPKIKRKSTKH